MTYLGHESYVGARALTEYRYKAFISYSHADERAGEWLHQALERYRVPANLVGAATDAGPVPEKLAPIFRDKNDLPAAGNLNDTIIAALKSSQFLIVLASPNAVKSKWVKEEIAQFKAFHGAARVLSIIIDGEPHATENPDIDSALECFPETLRYNFDKDGTKTAAEPLAADARTRGQGLVHSFGNDGKKAAITKLAAGLIGVPLDDLVQREAKRDAARARMWTGLMGAIAGVMALTTIYAVGQRNEARTQRAEAEGLIDFMITDVREEVQQKVGILDTLQMLGDRALVYYDAQDEKKLDDNALGRRARALHFSGSVEQQRNNLDAALAAYEKAAASTEELLSRDPENPDRIFEHAQSVFWVGNVAYNRNALSLAETSFQQYHDFAHALVAIDQTNRTWRLETAYAATNLGAVKFDQGKFKAALDFFQESTKSKALLVDDENRSVTDTIARGKSLSWEAFSHMALGNYQDALRILSEEITLYEEATGRGFEVEYLISVAERRRADSHLALGDISAAMESITSALVASARLVERDNNNARWKLNDARVNIAAAYIYQYSDMIDEAARHAQSALDFSVEVLKNDPTLLNAKLAKIEALAAKLENQATEHEATQLRAALNTTIDENASRIFSATVKGTTALAKYHATNKEHLEEFSKIRKRAVEQAEIHLPRLTINSQVWALRLYADASEYEKARSMLTKLDELGVHHPIMVETRIKLQDV